MIIGSLRGEQLLLILLGKLPVACGAVEADLLRWHGEGTALAGAERDHMGEYVDLADPP